MTDRTIDHFIAGAGPIGLALAIEVGLPSVSRIVVEQHKRVGLNPRAKLATVLLQGAAAPRLAAADHPS